MSPTFSVVFFLCAIVFCAAITQDKIEELKGKCRTDIIDTNPRMVALAVRLSFHDCVGDRGCDGCVDLNIDDNAGLENVLRRLRNYYNRRIPPADKTEFSLADWIALCGVAASEKGFENGGYTRGKEFSFKVGRVTSDTCNGDNVGRFPHPHWDHHKVMRFFLEEFGLNETQATVLLGAHSLGRASENNSGWNGPWTRNTANLDNEFYTNLILAVTQGWVEKEATESHYQWMRPQGPLPEMMFHADMCLIKYITVDSDGHTDCRADVSTCDDSSTEPLVTKLSEDNDEFVEQFIDVFTVMIENVGKTNVTLREADGRVKGDVPSEPRMIRLIHRAMRGVHRGTQGV